MATNDPLSPKTPAPQDPSSAELQPNYVAVAPAPRSGGAALTTALIVLIVALLFIMLIFSLNGNDLFKKGGSEDISHLQTRNSQLRADTNAARQAQGLAAYPEGANSARNMADRLQRDATSLASLTSQWEKELARKDEELRKIENELAARAQNSQQLYAQISELQARLASAGTAEAQLSSLQNDLQIARNQADALRQQLADFQSRPTNEQLALLNQELDASVSRVKELEIQIDALLEAQKNNIERTKYDELVAELEKLRPQVNSQRYEIQRLRALQDRTRLFSDSYKDLPVQAATLFLRLRNLEDTNPQQLAAAYQTIGTSLNARIVHRQTFAEGSSQVPFAREAVIGEAISQSKGSDSFYLVVGYASKTGDKASNRELSAKRSTTVASMVDVLKDSGQQVKAVYLGETKRFSATENQANQICEVWEIKKQK